jgi:hypothetical protein
MTEQETNTADDDLLDRYEKFNKICADDAGVAKKPKRVNSLFTQTQLDELTKLLKVKHLLSQSTINQTVINIMERY